MFPAVPLPDKTDFTIDRSAEVLTVVAWVEVLGVVGSLVAAETVAVLERLAVRAGSIFFFNDTAATEIYTLSLHDALPISELLAQVQPVPEAETKLVPAGSGSETESEAAF